MPRASAGSTALHTPTQTHSAFHSEPSELKGEGERTSSALLQITSKSVTQK